METCSQCAGSVARARREQTRVVDGTTFHVRAPALACKQCRAVFLPGDGLARVDLEVAAVIAMRAQPNGAVFRFCRRALGLRGLELAALLHVTPETISRWENDQRAVDVNAWVTIGSLVLERALHPPATLRRLLALQKPRKLPRTVRLELTESEAPPPAKPASSRTKKQVA